MPMDKNFTRFLTFDKIDINEIDLFADAFGFDQFYTDVVNMFTKAVYEPDDKVVMKIITNL